MFLFIIVFIAQLFLLLAYFKIAEYFNITDKPNERSSHNYITIRGGGIVFTLAALLWFLMYGLNDSWIVLALLLLATVSFIDDLITLPARIRILTHFLAVSILLWQLQVFGLPWYGILLTYIVVIGWINAFNFMDGINGITAFYAFVALVTFVWINRSVDFVSYELIIVLIISVLVFSIFNMRKKAKTFAGDVGSVCMAFLLAWFMISLIVKTGRVEYILLFSVYGIDTVITILFRMWRRENIFEAHRTHLFQYMSNELKWPHILVSGIYGLVQVVINIVAIVLISSGKMTWNVFIGFLLVLSIGYLLVRQRISKTIQLA